MGYRSDVTAIIYPAFDYEGAPATPEERTQRYETMKVIAAAQHADVFNDFGDSLTWDDDNRMLVMRCYGVKWYESYPDVQAFEAMLSAFADLDYAYEFVRIGEGDDDLERRSYNESYDVLRVTRSVEIDI
jgi:hypothetical protein